MNESHLSDSVALPVTIKSTAYVFNTSISTDNNNSTMRIDGLQQDKIKMLQSMFRLQVTDVFKTDECKDLMNYFRTVSSNLQNCQDSLDITEIADYDQCMEFLRSYIFYVTENYNSILANIAQRQYINFIKFVMALWNMSDKFDSLCVRMVSFNIDLLLIRFLGKMNISLKLLESKQVQLMMMSVVGILHNINTKLQYTRSRYRDENIVQYLMPLAALDTTINSIGLKTAALLLLAFLVNENENSLLNSNDDHIIYILDILKSALESPKLYSSYYGYHSLEILYSLRHIASPDSNKRSLVNNKVLSLIEIVLKEENEEQYQEELVAGLELLWSLSFSKECLSALNNDDCDLKARVEVLAQHCNQNVVLSARGILWNISAQRSISINNLIHNDSNTPNANGHVMISYQHSTQEVMVKIKDKLLCNGYKVWLDTDHMRGSFVDAMAEGIQHASVLLLGMCQAFKNSPHCRQEVKYAYTLGIPLVPVMLEEGFTPDGWLGLMCATLIHTEFIDPYKFENNILQLQRQLGVLGKVYNRPLSNQDSLDGTLPTSNNLQCNLKCCQEGLLILQESMSTHQINNNMVDSTSDLLISFKSDHSSSLNNHMNNRCLTTDLTRDNQQLFRINSASSHRNDCIEEPMMECYICTQNAQETPLTNSSRFQVLSWSLDQCKSWFFENFIDSEKFGYPLTHIDGTLLFELAEMRLTAPESYFSSLKDELKLNFIERLNLSRALRKLDELP